MSNVKEYKDIVAFYPGYYIADIIDDMEISQNEFAARMGTTAQTLSKLINGQANISNDLAKKLKNYKMKCERYLNKSAFRTFFYFKQ